MKKIIILLPIILLISSCGVRHTPSVNTTDITKIDFTKDLTKSEKNCAYNFWNLMPIVGSSYSAIEVAKEAGFRKVLAVDHQYDNFLLFRRSCIVVYGN